MPLSFGRNLITNNVLLCNNSLDRARLWSELAVNFMEK